MSNVSLQSALVVLLFSCIYCLAHHPMCMLSLQGDIRSKPDRNESSSEKQEDLKHDLGEGYGSPRGFHSSSKIQTAASANYTEQEHFCPPGCSMGLYKRVISLTRRYLDAERSLVDTERTVAMYDRARKKYLKKLQQIGQKLGEIENEVGYTEKERKDMLDRLPLFYPLTADQLYCFTSNDDLVEEQRSIRGLDTVGPKLSHQCGPLTHVLFRTDGFKMLQSNIHELENESAECKEAFNRLNSDLMQCRRERNNLKRTLAALKVKCDELQLQKFGQIIDLELLDEVS